MPEPGKKVYWLEGNIQSILPITGGFEAATEALGWDLTTITYDPSDPQGPNAAMQQAVDADADFIAISGQPVTAIETALAAAKAKEIPVFAMFGENEADPELGVVAVVGGLNTTAANAENLADWVIADSQGEADALLVTLPDFTILQYAEQKMTDQFDANCTTCSYDTLETTIADLTAGNVPGQIVSYLQSHPDVKYVNLAIGDLATGLPEALEAAGITGVTISGGVPNIDQIQSLIDGTHQRVEGSAAGLGGVDDGRRHGPLRPGHGHDGRRGRRRRADLHARQRRGAGVRLRRRARIRGPVESSVGSVT